MLILAQIGLTVWACIRLNKAGRSWALGLIPVGLTLLLGYLSAFTGATDSAIFMIDAACVVALVLIVVLSEPKEVI
jgi:hypothetical protein